MLSGSSVKSMPLRGGGVAFLSGLGSSAVAFDLMGTTFGLVGRFLDVLGWPFVMLKPITVKKSNRDDFRQCWECAPEKMRDFGLMSRRDREIIPCDERLERIDLQLIRFAVGVST